MPSCRGRSARIRRLPPRRWRTTRRRSSTSSRNARRLRTPALLLQPCESPLTPRHFQGLFAHHCAGQVDESLPLFAERRPERTAFFLARLLHKPGKERADRDNVHPGQFNSRRESERPRFVCGGAFGGAVLRNERRSLRSAETQTPEDRRITLDDLGSALSAARAAVEPVFDSRWQPRQFFGQVGGTSVAPLPDVGGNGRLEVFFLLDAVRRHRLLLSEH